MDVSIEYHWLTSKEVLAKTGISRATLNNYIKKKILPAPVVQPPESPNGKTKRIGYFPEWVLKRIQDVQLLKQEGKSIRQISEKFQDIAETVGGQYSNLIPDLTERSHNITSTTRSDNGVCPKLTIEGLVIPAYFLDHDFAIIWINHYAEREIFHQRLMSIELSEHLNVFKLLFDWRFHECVKNWRDLIALHIAFVKMKYAKTWFDDLYEGISKSEVLLLKEIYDAVKPFTDEPIHKTYFQFLTGDTISEAYGIFTLFCVEGFFFLYTPLSHI